MNTNKRKKFSSYIPETEKITVSIKRKSKEAADFKYLEDIEKISTPGHLCFRHILRPLAGRIKSHLTAPTYLKHSEKICEVFKMYGQY